MVWDNSKLTEILKEDGVVTMPTDTLYGITGRAQNISVVERIYELRKRALQKPCIILIGNIDELKIFSINLSEEHKKILENYWPGPVSIILDCEDEKFSYLHRGTKTLAFRLPSPQPLRDLLLKVGPLIAPSANPEGLSPAQNITEAKEYFGNLVDLYIDGGELAGKASKLVRLHKDGSIAIIRQ